MIASGGYIYCMCKQEITNLTAEVHVQVLQSLYKNINVCIYNALDSHTQSI